MKNFKLKKLIGLALVGGLSALSASTVFAAANTLIQNKALLTFDVGGTPTSIVSSPAGNSTIGGNLVTDGAFTEFREDRVINFTVAEVGGTDTVIASSTAQVQTFTVTNNGNAPQDFLLAAIQQANGTADPFGGVVDDFAPTNVKVFVDTNATGIPAGDVYLAGTDTGIFIDGLGAGETRTVYIVADIPAVADGSLAVMTLVAQVAEDTTVAANETAIVNADSAIVNDNNGNASPGGTFGFGTEIRVVAAGGVVAATADNPAVMDTVFNDPAGATAIDEDATGTDTQDAAQNGQHSDSDSYTVQAAALTVSKNAAILWDPVNVTTNPKAITGAYMTYTIVVTNNGAASASLTSMADTLVAELALDFDNLNGDGTATTASAGAARSAVTESFGIAHGDLGIANTRTATSPVVCTGILADADGCDITGQVITLNFATLLPADAGGGTPYLAGELKANETVTITFNVIIQP